MQNFIAKLHCKTSLVTVFFSSLFLFSSFIVSAQTPPLCQSPCQSQWDEPVDAGITNSMGEMTFTYRYRICNGHLEIQYYNITFSYGNFDMLSQSALNELLELYIISKIGSGAIPDCSTMLTTNYIKFYTASCGVWLKCTYNIEPQTPNCDMGFSPLPNPQATTVDVWKYQSCGQVCCKKIYEVCKTTNPTTGGNLTKVKKITVEKASECENDPNGINPLYDKPCLDGCY